MKSYPYIGYWEEAEIMVLFVANREGLEIEGDENYTCEWSEHEYKNITHEYLANTYGEVVSPEHAEFIIELCESNGFELAKQSKRLGNFFSFYVNKFCFLNVDSIVSQHCKKITIPLPPKADKQELSEWPQIGDDVCWSNGCYKGVVKARHWNDLWVMESCGEFSTLYIDDVSKPKTPEEELLDEIVDIIDNASCSEQAAEYIVEAYGIKKPQ